MSDSSRKVVVFDFDGTLFDSRQMIVDIFFKLLPDHPTMSKDEIEDLRGMSLSQAIKALGIKTYQLPVLLARGRREMNRLVDDLKPYPGIDKSLAQIKRDGYEIYVLSTNSKTNIDRCLENHGLTSYFKQVIGGIGLTGKTRAIKSLLKRLGLDPDQMTYIGDETRDVNAAKSSGVNCVAVTWGLNNTRALRLAGATSLCDSPAELKNKLKLS